MEKVKLTLDLEDVSNKVKFDLLIEVLNLLSTQDKHVALDLGITYLNNLKNPRAKEYISTSNEIMRKLHNDF